MSERLSWHARRSSQKRTSSFSLSSLGTSAEWSLAIHLSRLAPCASHQRCYIQGANQLKTF